MSVPAAYIGVIIIWSTTPLAIQWSSVGAGFLFAVLGRMVIGMLVCLLLVVVFRGRLPWHRAARNTYLAATLGIFGTMLCIYWGAQFIPSGLISVVYGLMPVLTGIIAAPLLAERSFTMGRVTAMLLGVTGLAVIFGSSVTLGEHAAYGIGAVLVGVTLHALGTVLIKRIDASVSALEVTTGALMLAVPLFLATWLIFDGTLPADVPLRAAASIVYLGVFGSVIGFVLYFYVLRRISAGGTALITLIAPVSALWIGHGFNNEPLTRDIVVGTSLILTALVSYHWGDRWFGRVFGADSSEPGGFDRTDRQRDG
ncbi:MAG: hypothetical protein FD165_610 [Gammaproteobacteria bacterium]|nr:MAG: hypothetical protein FD165_610 [Gammaproteobacteria bacterium]TND02128.1 MAG: hypothetical protein FD120_2292 [Gammaproteobacteria bacterium]